VSDQTEAERKTALIKANVARVAATLRPMTHDEITDIAMLLGCGRLA
jgi:hypothetical protein